MSDPTRTATLTALLDSSEVRRMVVAWELVGGDPERPSALIEWSRASGVPYSAAKRIAIVLLRHGICRLHPETRAKTTDPEALRIVAHHAAASLRTPGRRSR